MGKTSRGGKGVPVKGVTGKQQCSKNGGTTSAYTTNNRGSDGESGISSSSPLHDSSFESSGSPDAKRQRVYSPGESENVKDKPKDPIEIKRQQYQGEATLSIFLRNDDRMGY